MSALVQAQAWGKNLMTGAVCLFARLWMAQAVTIGSIR